jgi:hypothetical protein
MSTDLPSATIVTSHTTTVAATSATPESRPEVQPAIIADVNEWFTKTDNLVQRKNALWEYREANKSLFPARFNPNDPRRGQTPFELKSGRDTRRVQTPYIYRGTLQITAMSVPEDLDFAWQPREQVKPPAVTPELSAPTVASDPTITAFGDTLRITQRSLLDEARWIEKLQAWVQDADTYPMAILKCTFRRDYQTTTVSPQAPDKDVTDGLAAVQQLIEGYARRDFDTNDARYAQMLQGLRAVQQQARISRWYGLDLQLVPLDAFGVLEDATDIVNVYDASAMFHDVLLSGDEIMRRFPYRQDADGTTYGVLPSELTAATPWDTNNASTDPNARNHASRNRQLTAPNVTPINVASTTGTAGIDPRKRQYLVREIWCKRDRTVYVLIRGLTHYVDKYIPQKRSEQWYPFYLLAPNRVPTEIYGASSVELKRDIQARIHRKRTDEEKARWLHLPRGIYNRATGVDEKEMVKLQDVQPGQLRGINFGTTQVKIDDLVQWWRYDYNPESFNTTKDEQDLDLMGSLPVQALGQTGSANFATEVSVAANGSAIATQFRKSIIKRAIDNFLSCTAEELLQELTHDEVVRIAGAFSVWPTIFDEAEAQRIVEDAQARAMETAARTVMLEVQQEVMTTGIVPAHQAISQKIQAYATPIWQTELTQTYGSPEPLTREALFRRLKVEVKSSFSSKLDKQQNLQMLSQLAGACFQIGQAAQGLGVPFLMRPILLHHADLVGGTQVVDEAFPAVSPAQIAAFLAQRAQRTAGPQPAPGPMEAAGGNEPPAAQGNHGADVQPAEQAANALSSAPNPAIG